MCVCGGGYSWLDGEEKQVELGWDKVQKVMDIKKQLEQNRRKEENKIKLLVVTKAKSKDSLIYFWFTHTHTHILCHKYTPVAHWSKPIYGILFMTLAYIHTVLFVSHNPSDLWYNVQHNVQNIGKCHMTEFRRTRVISRYDSKNEQRNTTVK